MSDDLGLFQAHFERFVSGWMRSVTPAASAGSAQDYRQNWADSLV
jgi:hypothetical protein